MIEACALIRVPFCDVDITAIVWHGHYPKYFEEGRSALLDKIDYNYQEMLLSGYTWPVIDMRVKYIKPIRLGMNIEIQAMLSEYENRLKVDYLLTDSDNGTRLTKGYTVQVAVSIETGEMRLRSPEILLEKLRVTQSC